MQLTAVSASWKLSACSTISTQICGSSSLEGRLTALNRAIQMTQSTGFQIDNQWPTNTQVSAGSEIIRDLIARTSSLGSLKASFAKRISQQRWRLFLIGLSQSLLGHKTVIVRIHTMVEDKVSKHNQRISMLSNSRRRCTIATKLSTYDLLKTFIIIKYN